MNLTRPRTIAIVVGAAALAVVTLAVIGSRSRVGQRSREDRAVNQVVNSNASAVVSVDSEDSVTGISYRFPSNWSRLIQPVSGGSFETQQAGRTLVFEPFENTLDFPPAGRCLLQMFSSGGKPLAEWVEQSKIYDVPGAAEPGSGLVVLSESDRRNNNIAGLDVTEGGEGPQRTRSFYFLSRDGVNVLRFGYYVDVAATPEVDFKAFSQTCEDILKSMSFANT